MASAEKDRSQFPEVKPDQSIIGVVQINSHKVTSVVAKRSSNHGRELVLQGLETIRFRVDGREHELFLWCERIEKDLQRAIEEHVHSRYGISVKRAQIMGTAA